MPTIIDQLVVSLSLDPSQFTQGQRQMAQNLRQMETGAERAAKNIEHSGSQVVSFFRTLEHPIASLRGHFERLATVTTTPQRNLLNLAQQGRRTGQEIEAGALRGAAGVRALGVAGLTAVAAFVALDKVRSSATETARNLFGVGIGAVGAGMPIHEYTALSQALLHTGNVPEAETQGWLSQLRGMQVRAQQGDTGAAQGLATISRFAPTANAFTDSPEKILEALAQHFHSVTGDVAIGIGEMIGQSDALALALHNLGAAGLEEQIQLERQRSATEGQTQAAKDLTQAQTNLDIAWQNLERRIGEEIDPALTAFDNILASILDRLTGKQGSSIGRDALLMLLPGGPAIVAALHARDAATGEQPTTTQGQSSPADTRNWWQRNAPTWLGGQVASPAGPVSLHAAPQGDVPAIPMPPDTGQSGTELAINNFGGLRRPGLTAGPVGGGFKSFATPQAGAQATASLLQTYQDRHGLNTLRGIITRWAPPFENNTERLIAEAAQQTGFAPDQPLNLHDAATLSAVTAAMIRNEVGIRGPSKDMVNSVVSEFANANVGVNAAHLRSIQAAQAGGSTSTTHATNNDIALNGGIHVTVAPGSDGYKIGEAINAALQSQLLTSQINTGQQ